MDVHEVVRALAQDIAHLASQRATNRYARQRAIAVDGHTPPDANHVRGIDRSGKVRGDDVDVMAAKPRLTREEVNVLTDSAEVRIVVLRYLSDSESVHGGGPGPRPRVVGSEAPVPTPQLVHTPDRATRRERNSVMMPRPTLTDGFFARADEAGSGRC